MGGRNLPVRILQNVGVCTLQHTRRAAAEASRMVAEKVGALAEAQTAAAAAIFTGRREKIVAGKVLNTYRKRVRANRRRLSRR